MIRTLRQGALIGAALSAVLVAAALPLSGAGRQSTSPGLVHGPAGSDIILDPFPGSGSVLVAVAVRAGSAYETPDTRGVTHLLEHLLFNGSERFTREEISGWVDDSGAFLNAFTRKETTVYFLLARSDLLEESIEILSQMLLHPVFPPGEVEKERKVVLEEMSQGLDDPREAISRTADRYLYRSSPLSEPVIGYPATIEGVTRERILEYYRRRYTPDRMRIFLMGDFESPVAISWINDYFSFDRGEREAGAVITDEISFEPRWAGEITRREVEGAGGRVELLVRMPPPGDGSFPAALLLADMLGSPSSPLEDASSRAGLPTPDVALEVHSSFSALRISVEDTVAVDSPEKLIDIITGLAGWRPDEERLEMAKTSFGSAEIFDRERYHYYFMLNGEALALTGSRWFEAVSKVGDLGSDRIGKLTEKYFGSPEFNCFYASTQATDVRMKRRKTVLENLSGGLTAAVRQRDGSGVEALCLLFPGRACAGPESGLGWAASALHTVLENSAGGAELEERLAAEGARLQWGDNPYIPMDDYLVNPSWSFIRLETPAGSMPGAAALLADFLESYVIDGDDILGAAPVMARESLVRRGHSSAALKAAIYSNLFDRHPYGTSIFPVPGSLSEFDISKIRSVGEALHRNQGSTVTLVSPMDPAVSLDLLRDLFGGYGATGSTDCPPADQPPKGGNVEGRSPGKSAYLATAWRLDGLSAEERAALAVACEALSRRMQLDIRETRGLAYSTGCSLSEVGEYAVVMASLGTRGENAKGAETALREDIEGLASEPLTPAEAATARSRLISRLSRRDLSCAGEALGIGLDHLLRGGDGKLELIASAPFGTVLEMAGILSWEQALVVRLLPSENGPEKKSMPPGMMRR